LASLAASGSALNPPVFHTHSRPLDTKVNLSFLPLLLIVPEEGAPEFFVPAIFSQRVSELSWIDNITIWEDDSSPFEGLESLVSEIGLSSGDKVLIDDHMWALFSINIQDIFDSELGLASNILDELRTIKDDKELEAMRRAADIADEVSEAVRSLEAIGMKETELAAEINYRIQSAGAEPAYDPVASSGPNTARPSHRAGNRTIERGDPVLFDFGCRVNGYSTDQARVTVFEGNPPEGFESAHDAVISARDAAIDEIAPDVKAADIAKRCRSVLEERGYGDQIIHRSGHGIGLDVHEKPNISQGDNTLLKPGMTLSLEPGIYFPGKWGIRIEGVVAVTETGARDLNTSPYQWEPF
jgi:Xaa-Pro aminopeptidase